MVRRARWLLLPLLGAGCAWTQRTGTATDELDEPALVTVEGARQVRSFGWGAALLYVEADEHVDSGSGARAPSLWTRDGEALLLKLEAIEDLVVPYRRQDGARPRVEWAPPVLSINGKPASLILGAEADWRYLGGADPAVLASLRLIEIRESNGPPTEAQLALLRRLATVNPAVGLAVGAVGDPWPTVGLFHPRLLILERKGSAQGEEAALPGANHPVLAALDRLEYLVTPVPVGADLAFVASLPSLRRLVLTEVKEGAALRTLPPRPARLEQLVIQGDALGLDSLDFTRGLERVNDLQLYGCKSLTDAGAVASLPHLTSLTLACDGAPNLAPLASCPALRRFGGVTGKELPALVASLPRLEAIEIFEEHDLGDLAPLAALPHLTSLFLSSVALSDQQVATISKLHGLRVLLVGHKAFTEAPERIARLRTALPKCTIVPAGVCLGTGWILLLLPMVALSACARASHRRRRA